MGATAFASGNHVVFDQEPDLHTAAHEAAHVVQQAQGVQLYGGVGSADDRYERNADAVADRVVGGQSAADLLGAPTISSMAVASAVQRKAISDTTDEEREQQHGTADRASRQGFESAMALVAKQLHLTAEAIIRTIREPGDRTTDAILETLRTLSGDALWQLMRLHRHLGLQGDPGVSEEIAQLAPQLAAVNQALARFELAARNAQEYATSHDSKLEPALPEAQHRLSDLYARLGLQRRQAAHREVDPRPEPEMRAQAIRENLTAVYEAAHSVRLGLAKSPMPVVEDDLWKVVRHLGEVDALMRRVDKPADLLGYKAQGQQVLAEVQSLENEASPNPALRSILGHPDFTSGIRSLTNKFQAKE
jgi:hypothetical protein